jgi:hypothetical protein
MVLIIVPSRGRPDNVQQLIDTWSQTRTYADLQVVVDDDDEMLERYELLMETAPSWVSLEVTPRKRLGPTLNEYAVKAAPLYDILGFMGDDHRPRTHGWDRRFAASIAHMGGVGVVYGNDLFQGPNLPTAVWMSSCIVETLGFMVPPGILHLFADNFWRDMGNEIGRLTYISDVVIEHMHPQAGKSDWDPGYVEVNSGAVWSGDEQTYNEYKHHRFAEDMAKIKTGCIHP